jgi:hypothetical protein
MAGVSGIPRAGARIRWQHGRASTRMGLADGTPEECQLNSARRSYAEELRYVAHTRQSFAHSLKHRGRSFSVPAHGGSRGGRSMDH